MKELYTSPEVKLLCFVPAERVANTGLDFNDFFDVTLSGSSASPIDVKTGDIRFEA